VTQLVATGVGVSLRGRWVVNNVSLRCCAGQLTVIIGPNGAGKTTLVRALAGLQQIDSGAVTFDGIDLRSIPRRRLARRLAFVPQSTLFPFAFTVREVVATGRNPHLGRFQRERDEDREKIRGAMETTDTGDLINRPVTELSGGERQRVMIARSLATDAAGVLLDEPTANLDPAHAIDVLELCQSLSAAGRIVILTTQDLAMAMRYADRAVLMKSGGIAGAGSCEQVLTESALQSVFGVRAVRAYSAGGEQTVFFQRK
jgi:iron complex transport system ATP-binding protein